MPTFASPYPPIPAWPQVNFYDYLLSRPEVRSWPNYTLHVDGLTGERRRFREFVVRVEGAASVMSAEPGVGVGGLGLQQGKDLVGILSENCMDYPVLVFALLKMAVPVALVPSLLTSDEITALLRLSKLTCLFVSPALYPTAQAAASDIGLPEDCIFILHGHVDGKRNLPGLIRTVKGRGLASVATQHVRDETFAYMVYSSGTSGLPKGVMISHRNLYYTAMQMVIPLQEIAKVYQPPPLNTPEKIPIGLAFLPFYHAMGLHAHVMRALLTPFTIIILPRWDVRQVIKAIINQPVTHMSLVPSMVHHIVSSPEFAKVDLSRFIGLSSGAAYLPPEVREKLMRRIQTPFLQEGYGMSECTLAALSVPFPGILEDRYKHVPGMTGILLPSQEARVIREDGTDASFDEAGELLVRGPNVALGYYRNEKATRDTFWPDGWLRTGDRFKVDSLGRFFYVDRVKDILKISGTQVSPSEIENALLEHPERLIDDVAVAGVVGARLSHEEVPRAWVVLSQAGKRHGETAVFEALDKWVRTKLSKPKWLRGGYQAVDEIPKLPTGKVLRRKLQAEFARTQSGQGGSTRSRL
ncbi:acetyl-CoA synthetase-like protein [Auriscalpium vulgare]|uniref:Acetyl-CoA synthetase-like protein n=1 Tax=Auriscalpium vulgare TaxID=40419 RepID=A0ACB8S5J4_9AGAM|nr:acetyl-CoA synthetase-like protein [Auriscalpium vulgare]